MEEDKGCTGEFEIRTNPEKGEGKRTSVMIGPFSAGDLADLLKALGDRTEHAAEKDQPMMVRRIFTVGRAAENAEILETCIDALLTYSLGKDTKDEVRRIGNGMKALLDEYYEKCLGPEQGRVIAEFKVLAKDDEDADPEGPSRPEVSE